MIVSSFFRCRDASCCLLLVLRDFLPSLLTLLYFLGEEKNTYGLFASCFVLFSSLFSLTTHSINATYSCMKIQPTDTTVSTQSSMVISRYHCDAHHDLQQHSQA